MSLKLGNTTISGISRETKLNAHSLLDFKWTDHILNEMSWLRADTFSWQSGDVYTTAYNKLVEEVDNSKVQLYGWANSSKTFVIWTKTSTVSLGDSIYGGAGMQVHGTVVEVNSSQIKVTYDGNTSEYLTRGTSYDRLSRIGTQEGDVIYYRSPNGFKITTVDQEQNISNKYNTDGIAWYYILDTDNKRFKLPRTKFGFTGLRDGVGNYVAESLPNITGRIGFGGISSDSTVDGAFYRSTISEKYLGGSGPYTNPDRMVHIDASRSSSTYQDNAPVQQRATQMYLYFYVGEFSQTATEQTAGITTEMFNTKADTTLSNINASSSAKQTIVGWGMPDYSAGVSLTYPDSSHKYTAPSDGLCVLFNFWTGAGNFTSDTILYINNIETSFRGQSGGSYYENGNGTISVPLRKGDVIYLSRSARTVRSNIFYPLKGAN